MEQQELTREIRDTIKRIVAHKTSFAARVRQAAVSLAAADCKVSSANLAEVLDLVTSADKRPLATALRDMKRRGEVESLGVGVYAVKGRPRAAITKAQAMWRVLRAKRVVSAEDLVELAQVSRGYAKDWLRELGCKQIVHAVGGNQWRLVKDNGPAAPDLPENAEKLRGIRKADKMRRAIEALGRAQKRTGGAGRASEGNGGRGMKSITEIKKIALEYAAVHGAFGEAELAPLAGMREDACRVILNNMVKARQLAILPGGDYSLPAKQRADLPKQETIGLARAAGGAA